MLWTIQPSYYQNASLVEAALGYVFISKDSLFEALTHRSALVGVAGIDEAVLATRPWNERLEFLGDSVLGLVISEILLACEHGLSEGEMSRVRAAIVCETNLARIGREKLSIHNALVIGGSEIGSGGRDKPSMIADALESVLGAVFTDGGWDAARRVTRTLFADDLAGDLRRYVFGDAKTMFQELSQARLKATPTYDVIAESGPAHKKSFEMVVKVGDEVWGQGEGISKKDAAQAAAKAALQRMAEVSP